MIDLSAHQSALPNLRDMGNIPIASSPTSSTPLQTRPGLLYRAAAPTPEAVPSLQALSITHVFDLRSDVEIHRQGGPPAADACSSAPPALARHHVPVFQSTDYTPEAIALRFRDYAAVDTTAGFVSAYRGILGAGGERAFGPILRHLARRDPSPCLVHCTAGKDRTGLICAIVLSLCGVDDRTIAWEYGLTDEGLAPLKPAMVRGLMAAPGVALDEEGALRMLSSRPESMLATLEVINEEYGSVEDYVLNQCKLTPHEMVQIRENFIVKAPPTTNGDTSRPAL
ncbi:hypothetical protein EsDP_00003501 [Epichloe bromicola]|uniref:Tyrosine specific protein phosphatases domain-containing protein n=1 Tax=Epichloe bromicola TaxID=79588 RepID=A0ABQ0CP14_9HYPO